MRAKRVYLRTDRKHPIFRVKFDNNKEESFALPISRSDAKKLCDQMNMNIALGIFDINQYTKAKSAKVTIEQCYVDYLDYRQKRISKNKLSRNTFAKDILAIKQLVRYFNLDRVISTISVKEINSFQEHLCKKLKPQSVNGYFKHLQGMFSYAIKKGYCEENIFPKEEVEPVEVEAQEIRFLETDEIENIRQALSKHKQRWHLDVFNIGLWTGLRREEIIYSTITRA